MTPGRLGIFTKSPDPVCPPSLLPSHAHAHVCTAHACTRPVSFGTAGQSSPARRNVGEVEVTEFPPLSCHLLATRSWLPEAAWAGKGSKRGSGLLLLAQEQSQQLQSCCEVMPGAACVFLQVETDSGRVGWRPQPQRARRENTRPAACAPAPPCQASGPAVRWARWPHLYPELPRSPGRAFRREHCGLGPASPRLQPLCPGAVDLPRRVQKAPEKPAGAGAWHRPPAPQALSRPGAVASRFSLAAAPAWARSMLWPFATRRLGILQQPPGGPGQKRGPPLPSAAPSTRVKSRRQERRKCQVLAGSMVPRVTESGLPRPHLSDLHPDQPSQPSAHTPVPVGLSHRSWPRPHVAWRGR